MSWNKHLFFSSCLQYLSIHPHTLSKDKHVLMTTILPSVHKITFLCSYWFLCIHHSSVCTVLVSHLRLASLLLILCLLIQFSLWQKAQPRQILLKVSAQLSLRRPRFSVFRAAVRRQAARRWVLLAEGDVPQLGELSGDDLLSDVVLPSQTWKQRGQVWKLENAKQLKLGHPSGLSCFSRLKLAHCSITWGNLLNSV